MESGERDGELALPMDGRETGDVGTTGSARMRTQPPEGGARGCHSIQPVHTSPLSLLTSRLG